MQNDLEYKEGANGIEIQVNGTMHRSKYNIYTKYKPELETALDDFGHPFNVCYYPTYLEILVKQNTRETNAVGEKGLRDNKQKIVRPGLTSPYADEQLSLVLAFGAKKYDTHNWMKGLSFTETIDSLERHLQAMKKGIFYDADSGQLHAAHLLANAHFLAHFYALYDEYYKKFDDLPSQALKKIMKSSED